MTNPTLALLGSRRSVKVDHMGDPGPSAAELEHMLAIATRVPDHKKLAPWRFIVFEGAARARFGEVLAGIVQAEDKIEPSPVRLEAERQRFQRAPVVVAVISSLRHPPPAPEWEQQLSAGAACFNLCLAANAMGYGTNWLTEWLAYSPGVAKALGLGERERVAGFVYIGTARERQGDRERPHLSDVVTRWQG